MRKLSIFFLFIFLLFILAFECLSFSENGKHVVMHKNSEIISSELRKLQLKASLAKSFIQQKNFESSFCFLIDMNLPANRKRFFIYDLNKDTVIHSGLVAHGNCNQYCLKKRKYSNDVGSGCTSLGRYKTGNFYEGRFGLAFKLYGLDNSNSNAFKRYVVLHSHSCVPENETEDNVCQSSGCPTVSPKFLKQLTPMIKSSEKPVLLWIFE